MNWFCPRAHLGSVQKKPFIILQCEWGCNIVIYSGDTEDSSGEMY